MMRRPEILVVAWAVGALACGSESPMGNLAPTPDGGMNLPPPPGQDGGVNNTPPPVAPNDDIVISGRTLRLDAYLDGQEIPVGGAGVQALGVAGVSPVASDAATGGYSMQVPQNGSVVLTASNNGYLTSYEQLRVADYNVTRDFYLAYQGHVDRITTAFNVDFVNEFTCHAPNAGQCRYAMLMGRVVDDGSYDNGRPTPIGDVAKEDFTILGEGNATWYRKGPYFFFFNGQPDPNALATKRERDAETNKYVGGLFVIFVEIPVAGPRSKSFEVSVSSYAGGADRRYFGPVQFNAYREAFTWISVAETFQPAPEPPPPNQPPPPPPGDADFDNEVYPLFLPVNQGGYGCQGCHTNQGGAQPAGGMNLYGGPEQAYQALDPATYPARVNVASPADSLLISKPLYEADGAQNHPIFAFATPQDPAYQVIYGWIRAGGLRVGGAPPPPVSFYNDVRPLLYQPANNGGIGCYACHVSGVDANTAPAGLYFGGEANDLHYALTQATPADDGRTGEPYRINKNGNGAASLLLTNPLVGSPEPHPAKLLNGADDLRYQIIYRWIAEGYQNDSP